MLLRHGTGRIDNAFFTDGVQDEILTNLSKIADLKVVSRTSVMQYGIGSGCNLREIGQALGVSHVVEGSVQRVGNMVRATAQIIDAGQIGESEGKSRCLDRGTIVPKYF